MPPHMTVAILSYNRLHYLRALIESFPACRDPDIQTLIVDNNSREPGLQDYLTTLKWAQVSSRSCSMAEAVMTCVTRADSPIFLVLTDDMQCIRRDRRWLDASVGILHTSPWIGSVVLDAQRYVSVQKYFSGWRGWLTHRKRHAPTGEWFHVYPPSKAGFCGSGLNTIQRTETFRALGSGKVGIQAMVDASGGWEDNQLSRYYRRHPLQRRAILSVPSLIGIHTDPGGYAAKVRHGRRYGAYFPPPDGLYFQYLPQFATEPPLPPAVPMSYEGCLRLCPPLGWSPALDARGHARKGNPDPQTPSVLV